MSPQADLEDRVANLERILEHVIDKASKHPLGRKILEMLEVKLK
jgi:hypothetical protein